MNSVTNSITTHRPIGLYALLALLGLLGPGGLYGGVMLLADPTGALLGLPPDLLNGLPMDNFFLPGLFLLVIMGVLPFFVAYGVWRRAPWGWGAALALSIGLVLWVSLQLVLWWPPAPIQLIFLVWGLVMFGLCWLPAVRRDLGA